MSVNIGSKPIVTTGLTHLYDQLSPVSMPYGSEVWYNHLPDSYSEKFAVKSKGLAKTGLAVYGSKTAHAHLKGYDTYDGSSDYWEMAASTHTDLPSINFGTFIIWARHSKANTTTRGVGGWGGSSNNGYYSSFGQVYYTASKLKPQWYEYGTSSSARICTIEKDLDAMWHMWTYRNVSTSVRNFSLDCGDWGSASNSSSANRPFNTNTYNFHIGSVRKGSSHMSGWVGDIGPWYNFNRILSDAEVRQMYNANKDRFNY